LSRIKAGMSHGCAARMLKEAAGIGLIFILVERLRRHVHSAADPAGRA